MILHVVYLRFLSLAVCFALALAFAGIGFSYLAGIPVAPAAAVAYASARGTRRSTSVLLAIGSCLITIALIAVLLVLLLWWVGRGFADFD